MGGLSAVALGDGQMLTAAHAPLGVVALVGSPYDPIAGTKAPIRHGDGTFADLLVFAIHGFPNLRSLWGVTANLRWAATGRTAIPRPIRSRLPARPARGWPPRPKAAEADGHAVPADDPLS